MWQYLHLHQVDVSRYVTFETLRSEIPANLLEVPANSLEVPANSLEIPANSLEVPIYQFHLQKEKQQYKAHAKTHSGGSGKWRVSSKRGCKNNLRAAKIRMRINREHKTRQNTHRLLPTHRCTHLAHMKHILGASTCETPEYQSTITR